MTVRYSEAEPIREPRTEAPRSPESRRKSSWVDTSSLKERLRVPFCSKSRCSFCIRSLDRVIIRAERRFRFSVMVEKARPFSPDFMEMTIAFREMISSSSESARISETRRFRITSYNVCYTKLLRHRRERHRHQGIGGGRAHSGEDRNRADGIPGQGGLQQHRLRLQLVITSYSIHYTKLYEDVGARRQARVAGLARIIGRGRLSRPRSRSCSPTLSGR